MRINDLMNSRGLSSCRLAEESGISYRTLLEITSGRRKLNQCSADTVYHLAKALDVPMEELLESCVFRRCSFECFRTSVLRRIREIGDYAFILEMLDSDRIRRFYELGWYPESLYLLAMLDCQCRFHKTGIEPRYDDLRALSLSSPLYPLRLIAETEACGTESLREKALRDSIPEFRRFNIIETEEHHVY